MKTNETALSGIQASIEQKKREAFKKLRQLYTHVHGKPAPYYNDDTANSLTRCIIDYLECKGHQAERVNCFGNPIPQGNGLYKFGKTNMNLGTSDIHAVCEGIALKIEVKIGSDRMSSYQKQYRDQVIAAGGKYFVARSFDKFLIWFHNEFGG
ncbi:hypothetical protein [Ekhidna sp.]|uniref:hypothetical protein n=1 Tax=Ekhidna sp. TaxID=2608089 RepID=UPI003C7D0051